MEEDFVATLKLVSGEEIIGRVCYLPDEDKILIEGPLQVEKAKTKKGSTQVQGFTLVEWITATFDNMFVLNKDHILTMTETDSKIEDFYNKMLNRINSGSLVEKNKFTERMGYLGSVSEMKKSLEKIYKSS
jgi:hypothetical protein